MFYVFLSVLIFIIKYITCFTPEPVYEPGVETQAFPSARVTSGRFLYYPLQ